MQASSTVVVRAAYGVSEIRLANWPEETKELILLLGPSHWDDNNSIL